MAKLTIDGREIEAPDGAPLVEVIKENGIYVPNLCYIDGLPPYAGCRTCLVEIEGARGGLQLSCTSTVRDEMVVRTDTAEVKQARQYVLSLIDANHSDRCLTCHRRVKCMPGDVCLRDDVVTHRCLTCSKNYRCELQTTNDLLDMGVDNVEPWEGEDRTYYQWEQPEPDRANPFLEFDPQMCIICTRCVRACDDLRHTGAITLAGRGFSTRIAFGAGGPIDESNCDFCGSCIDVCPTATLMEKPNKWLARTEDWVSTTCTSCSVGCTISVGTRGGKPVIVKPDTINPFSDDQICVRGRFHYDAIKPKERLSKHLVREGDTLQPSPLDAALDIVADRLAGIREQHGAASIAFLGSPFATNEENYLVRKLAGVVGTPNIDFTVGPVNQAAAHAAQAAFGVDRLPADLTDIPTKAKTILVVADDLEETHNVAALRIKDAIDPRKLPAREPARLIVISSRRGELCDFAEPYGGVWLQAEAGQEAAVVSALAKRIVGDENVAASAKSAGLDVDALAAGPDTVTGIENSTLDNAAAILSEAAADAGQTIAVVVAPKSVGVALAAETTKAAANVALLLRGASAASSFYLLPTEANINGARDMGVVPGEGGLNFIGIVEAASAGDMKALVVAGDNPLMFAPGRAKVEEALGRLDLLVVIDQVLTDTAKMAHVVLADVPAISKDGTITSADRRVLRLKAAQAAQGEAQPAWATLSQLGQRLTSRLGGGESFSYEEASEITEEITKSVPGYDRFHFHGYLGWGKGRAVEDGLSGTIALQPVGEPASTPPSNGDVALLTGRTLFTSLEAASIHSPEADKLHREDAVLVNQYDAVELGISAGDGVVLKNGSAELSLKAALTNTVPRGSVFLSSYYDGGVVNTLLPSENGSMAPARVTIAKQS